MQACVEILYNFQIGVVLEQNPVAVGWCLVLLFFVFLFLSKHLIRGQEINARLCVVWEVSISLRASELIVVWFLNHWNCAIEDIGIVQISESRIESVVQISHEEREVGQLITFQSTDLLLDLLQLHLFDQLRCHLIPKISIVLSMSQMYGDEIEQSVLDHEALGHTTLVTKHFAESFGNLSASHFGDILFVVCFDEADEPHLPHADELFVDTDEAVEAQILLQFLQSLLLVLPLAFLGADCDQVVLSSILED